ncbi:MAG: FAD-binding oxidoreductase [Arenicellales bacterium]
MSQVWKTRRLPIQPGPAAWNRLLPEPAPAVELSTAVNADVAIIGAGFAGLSAARRLIQLDPDLRIAVLEAGRIAEGPAGRNSGFMIDLPHDLSSDIYAGAAIEADQAETALNRRAIAFATDVSEENELPQEVFNPYGKINAAATSAGDQHNREYGVHLANMGESYRLLDAREMSELTGIRYYVSGLFTPGTVMLQPAAYIRGLAGGLKSKVSIYEQSPVLEIIGQPGGWMLKTPKGKISAGRVILANNGHAESFGFFVRRLMHVFTYASMTKPLPEGVLGGELQWGVTPADPMGTTVRRVNGVGGNRIVVRSRFTYNPSMTVSEGALARAGALHDKKFAARFPMLGGIPMEYRWAGHLCVSLNGVQAHGEVAKGVFSAVCQNGLGLAKGTLSGISAAELAMGQDTETTRALCAMDPPRRLPPEPLAWLGANTTMKWKEWRAGRE